MENSNILFFPTKITFHEELENDHVQRIIESGEHTTGIAMKIRERFFDVHCYSSEDGIVYLTRSFAVDEKNEPVDELVSVWFEHEDVTKQLTDFIALGVKNM